MQPFLTRLWSVLLLPLLALGLAGCGDAPAAEALTPATSTPATAEAMILHVIPAESAVAFTAQALGGRLDVLGSYGVLGGEVTLTPEDGQLRVTARVLIDTPSVSVGHNVVDEALKLGMETERYPVATFTATSTELVPVTEEEVAFSLAGTLTLHGETLPVTMHVGPATVIDEHMIATATMEIDLAEFGIALPEAVVNSEIALGVTLIADVEAPPFTTPGSS